MVIVFVISDREPPEPIIFVHGIGNTDDMWEKEGYIGAFNTEDRFLFVENLSLDDDKVLISPLHKSHPDVQHPCYTVTISNRAFGDIQDSARELASFIKYVRESNGGGKVSLVAYSLGGVICRQYLVSAGPDHHINKLVTVSSPHLGSSFARFFYLYRALSKGVDRIPVELIKRFPKGILTDIEAVANEHGYSFKSKALGQLSLENEGDSDNFLKNLNNKDHPQDVKYYSIVCEADFINARVGIVLQKVLNFIEDENTVNIIKKLKIIPLISAFTDFVEALLDICGITDSESLKGDGCVSTHSQNMANIHNIIEKKKRGIRIFTEEYILESIHCNHEELKKKIIKDCFPSSMEGTET